MAGNTKTKSRKLNRNQIYKTLRKNYFISFLILIFVFVGCIILLKIFFTKPTYIYAKIKVGQGYWWVGGVSPDPWIQHAIKIGDEQDDVLGAPQAVITDVRYYPTSGSQIETFVTLKLKVSYSSISKTYQYDRSPVTIGSPMEVQLPAADITGTIIAVSKNPLKSNYIEKKIKLVYRGGYSKDFTDIYDAIHVGDTYYDGKSVVLQILNKKLQKNIWAVANDLTGQVFEQQVDTSQNIIVTVKLKVVKQNNQFLYGEDQLLRVGNYLVFSTPTFYFNNFIISKIY